MSRTTTQWNVILTSCGVSANNATSWASIFATNLDDETFDGGELELTQFLAQTLHESQLLSHMSENLNYKVEALQATFGTQRITAQQAQQFGRVDGVKAANQEAIANIVYGGPWGVKNLGNVSDGDGWKYRGSGLLEITGLSNFKLAEKRTDIPFSTNPELMRTVGLPPLAASIAWWKEHVTTSMLTDAVALRRCVNGGQLGLQECIDLAKALTTHLAANPEA